MQPQGCQVCQFAFPYATQCAQFSVRMLWPELNSVHLVFFQFQSYRNACASSYTNENPLH